MNGRASRTCGAAFGWRIASLLLLLCLAGTATATVSILPLGDSITHGGTGDGGVLYPTYRAWLYQDLRERGYDPDFVGSLDTPAAPAGSDPDNEGHSAYTAGEVLAELPAWLEAYPPPQVALIHLGTNDVLTGVPADRTAADLASIIGVLRARNPAMAILVAQVIPTSVESMNERIEVLNQKIAGLAPLSTAQSPVIVVDQYTGFEVDDDLQEGGAHPTTSGEQKMATQWMSALLPVLARGVPTVVTTTPAFTPTVIITVPAASQTTAIAKATVTPRFGARAYRIGGNAGQTRSVGIGSTGTASSGSRTAVPGASTSLTPPTKSFTRWYPAARWSSGLR